MTTTTATTLDLIGLTRLFTTILTCHHHHRHQ